MSGDRLKTDWSLCHAKVATTILTGITKTCPGAPGKPDDPGTPSLPENPCKIQSE